MQGDELKELRQQAGWTQARMAEALGINTNYLARMERNETPIEVRTERQIEALARTRIDVSYSDTLGKWVVAVITPGTTFAGREHHLIAAKPSLEAAREVAREKWVEGGKLAIIIERGRT